AFGGDPDNFQFPRWCLDMALLRAYGPNGKPAATPSFLALRPEGPQAGELVFVSGHPGTTDRLLTVAQLETLRDVELPRWLLRASELRGRFIQFAKTGAEADRIVEDPLNGLENSIKVRRKQLDALLDERLLQAKRDEVAALLVDGSQVADPKLRQRLWEGGAAALDAAHDPMIEFARRVDAPARAVRKSYEDEVEAPVDAAAEKIARARFRVYGTSVPPDATFTLRLNVVTVQGWKEDGHEVEPFTHLARLFERATGEEPFRIHDSW